MYINYFFFTVAGVTAVGHYMNRGERKKKAIPGAFFL